MKHISSVDLHFLIQELKILEGSKLQKIMHTAKNEIYLEFFISGKGKVGLHIVLPSFIYFSAERPSGKQLALGEYLVKHIINARCIKLDQVQLERVIYMEFTTKNGKQEIYIELFGKGNIIICKQNIIQQALVHKAFRERIIKKGQKFILPSPRLNIQTIKEKEFITHYNHRKDETISSILALDFGLGGIYAEEICLQANIDPKLKKCDEKQIKKVWQTTKDLLKKKIDARVVLENGNIIDVTPVPFEKYKNKKQQKLASFHNGIAQVAATLTEKTTPYEKKIKKIKNIIEKQQKQLDMVQEDIKSFTYTGDIIYSHYNELDQVLTYIQKKEKSWDEMKKELAKIKFIKQVDEKKGKIILEFPENT